MFGPVVGSRGEGSRLLGRGWMQLRLSRLGRGVGMFVLLQLESLHSNPRGLGSAAWFGVRGLSSCRPGCLR
jgi:hypothetical protein